MKNDEYMHTKTLVETSFYDSTNDIDVAIKKDSKGNNYVKGKVAKVRSYNPVLSKHFNKNMYDIKILVFIRPMIVGVKTTTEATKLISTDSMDLKGEPFTFVQIDADETKARFKDAWNEFCDIEQKEENKKVEEAKAKVAYETEIATLKAEIAKKDSKDETEEPAENLKDDVLAETEESELPKRKAGRPKRN